MIGRMRGRAALTTMGFALALGVAGCQDPGAAANAEADAEARAQAAEQAQKLHDRIAHNVECLSALRWQKAALSAAGIGDLSIYTGYYRDNLAAALGDKVIPAAPPAPALSAAAPDAYLDWAYADAVNNKFAAGTDSNGDGKLTPKEHSGRGFNIVASCVLEVAEVGKGPLAGKDKVMRMYRIQALQDQLKDKGA